MLVRPKGQRGAIPLNTRHRISGHINVAEAWGAFDDLIGKEGKMLKLGQMCVLHFSEVVPERCSEKC